jgi:FSR family fosmidomycin resistance protein-like MFS transporter
VAGDPGRDRRASGLNAALRMTQAAELLPASRASETKLVASVCLAHLVSHYYIVLLAPLFVFIRADYGVTYTELAFALTFFNLVSTVLQTPAGFFIDRTDARLNLVGGLILGAGAVAVAGLVDSFWVFIAMFGVLGLANTVFHPADYSLLSTHVGSERLTKAFSYHTCAGMAGSAIAPVTLLFMQDYVGWRGAFLGAAAFGFVAALVLMLQREPVAERADRVPTPKQAEPAGKTLDGWNLLMSPPILINLVFFLAVSIISGGLSQFLVVGLVALHDTPLPLANSALTGQLSLMAVGVLVGGVLAASSPRHNLITGCGLGVAGVAVAVVGMWNPGAVLLFALVSLSGLATGITLPSRDMIVRNAAPSGSFGKVFGFVSTGLHVGGMISPLIFGQFLDHGSPEWVFLFSAATAIFAALVVNLGIGNRRPA